MITEKLIISIGSVFTFGIIIKLSLVKVLSAIKAYQNNIKIHFSEAEKIKIEAELLLQKYQQQKNELQLSIDGTISSAKSAANEIIMRSKKVARENAKNKVDLAKKTIDASNENLLYEYDKKFITLTVDQIKDQEINHPSGLRQNISSESIISNVDKFQKSKSFH